MSNLAEQLYNKAKSVGIGVGALASTLDISRTEFWHWRKGNFKYKSHAAVQIKLCISIIEHLETKGLLPVESEKKREATHIAEHRFKRAFNDADVSIDIPSME